MTKAQIDRWLLGLTRASIEGGALAAKTFFGVAGASTLNIGVPALNWQQAATVFLVGMGYAFVNYLAANPFPDQPPKT